MFKDLKMFFCDHDLNEEVVQYDIAMERTFTCKKCGYNYKNIIVNYKIKLNVKDN